MGLEDVLGRGRLREGLSCLVQIGQIWRKSISGRANCMCRALSRRARFPEEQEEAAMAGQRVDREEVGGEDAGRRVGPAIRAVRTKRCEFL